MLRVILPDLKDRDGKQTAMTSHRPTTLLVLYDRLKIINLFSSKSTPEGFLVLVWGDELNQ
jgi:hypothetical protein